MEQKQRHITGTLCRNWAEEAEADRKFWKALSPAERISTTWTLSQELWKLKGAITDESRLRRDVARFVKR